MPPMRPALKAALASQLLLVVLFRSARRRTTTIAQIKRALEYLTGPEGEHPPSRDLDLLARLRIATDPGLLLAHLEIPKPGDFYFVAALQRFFHRVENQLDDLGGVLLRKADLFVNVLDDVRLGHDLPRSLRLN